MAPVGQIWQSERDITSYIWLVLRLYYISGVILSEFMMRGSIIYFTFRSLILLHLKCSGKWSPKMLKMNDCTGSGFYGVI